MDILIFRKDYLSKNRSTLSGNERKCSFTHPASEKVTQRDTHSFKQPEILGKQTLVTEEDHVQMVSSFESFPVDEARKQAHTPLFSTASISLY